MQPDLNVLKAISTLYDQVDFRFFRGFLAACEVEEVKNAIKATEHADVARGRAQMIMWLREVVETSRERASQLEIHTYDRSAPASRARSS
jgi:hypothetical protein